MAQERRIFHVERFTTGSGGPGERTLFFATVGGSKRSRTKFFSADQLPQFVGDEARFEAERIKGGRGRAAWRFVRWLDTPG
jgi:hypothetical protein